MREIDLTDESFYKVLNKIYEDFKSAEGVDEVITFANHVRHKYGIYINVRPNLERGEGQYELTRVFVEDEARYNWLLLEWT